MRLWHYKLIQNDLLPKSQLVAQWRELNSIFAKEDSHILINYIYEYPKQSLFVYTKMVLASLERYGVKVRGCAKMDSYFEDCQKVFDETKIFKEHDDTYLVICYWNLAEKHIRGQKDYDVARYNRLKAFVWNNKIIDGGQNGNCAKMVR